MVISLTLIPVFAARFLAGRPMPEPGPIYRLVARMYEAGLSVALRFPWATLLLSVAALGAGITILGAGIGFGKIGAAALESMASQPEVAARVQTAMIVIAALLEGATFFALIVCILVFGKTGF